MINLQNFLSGSLTRDQMMSKIAHGYCEELICRNIPIPKPEKIASDIVSQINMVCRGKYFS